MRAGLAVGDGLAVDGLDVVGLVPRACCPVAVSTGPCWPQLGQGCRCDATCSPKYA